MKSEDIHLSDWMRILVGEVPGSFYIEAFFRIVFIYLLLLVSMRLMGNRMGKPLTRNEMIAMVSLAAANGVALMAADRGLLPVVLIAAIVIGYQRWIAKRAARDARFESLVLDDLSILVADGRLNLDKLEEGVISRNQVFAKLRRFCHPHLRGKRAPAGPVARAHYRHRLPAGAAKGRRPIRLRQLRARAAQRPGPQRPVPPLRAAAVAAGGAGRLGAARFWVFHQSSRALTWARGPARWRGIARAGSAAG
jgi:hypothetical protein